MAYRKPSSRLGGLPGRHLLSRAGIIMLATASVVLMVMGKSGNPAVSRLQNAVSDAITPILAVAASPMNTVSGAATWVTEVINMRSENIALKNQNAQLMQWQSVAKDMEAENKSLRELLKVVPAQKHSYITARVVSDLGGPYAHSALIAGGASAGITKDQAVINESGLIGRVVEAGNTSARVLLLADINSRVPVITENSREKSILSGSNDDLPILSYLAVGSKVVVGERVVTTGDGGIFPSGIPVGIVTSIDRGAVKVQPFVDPAKVEYVSVVDYSL
jgi:rod shape-determining protein MreC